MKSKWYSRGWTFQEMMFSGRKIVFQGETVNWECGCSAWHEAQRPVCDDLQVQQEKEAIPASFLSSFENTAWPDFHRFARLVSLYNERRFTYPEDVLDAFAGIISVLNRTFVGGFISGLPQILFDSALLWQPHRPMHRRSKKGTGPACLPSWSWVGWQGTINSESWRSGYDYLRKHADEYQEENTSVWQPCSWHTTSTVGWFYVGDTGDRHPVLVTGHEYRDQCSSSSTVLVLPEGWTRHSCKETGKPFTGTMVTRSGILVPDSAPQRYGPTARPTCAPSAFGAGPDVRCSPSGRRFATRRRASASARIL